MQIPFPYDTVWLLAPLLWLILAIVVGVSEARASHQGTRITLWVAVQLLLPFIGFLAWLAYRWYEKKNKVEKVPAAHI